MFFFVLTPAVIGGPDPLPDTLDALSEQSPSETANHRNVSGELSRNL